MITLTLKNAPAALRTTIRDEKLSVDLVDGRILVVPLDRYPRLASAKRKEQQNWTLLGEGYAIEWPDLDEQTHRGGGSSGGTPKREKPQITGTLVVDAQAPRVTRAPVTEQNCETARRIALQP